VLPSFTPYSVWHDPQYPFEVIYFHIDICPDRTDELLSIPVKKSSLEQSLLQTMRHFSDRKDEESLEELCPILVRYIVETYNPSIVPLIGSEPRMEKVIHFIEQSRNKKITIESLAEIACMERAYFTRFFKKYYKHSPMEYVRRRKMSLATQKLLAGMPVEAVSEAIAYEDEKAFSRAFKKVYGISPREYRRSHILQP
jgi:AraC-like DNA-binding protein